MHKRKYLSLLLYFSMVFMACIDEKHPVHYTDYEAILLSRESLEKSVQLLAKQNIITPGKLYYKDNYIFISEKYKGVHVINNSNPSHPLNEAFISVPGCVDMAIKESALYVDNAVDLAVIDLSDIKNGKIKVAKRIRDAFPELVPPDGLEVPEKIKKGSRASGFVIVEWKKL